MITIAPQCAEQIARDALPAHHSRHLPTISYAREDAGFHTRICIYDYFAEIKAGGGPVFVRLDLRDRAGMLVAERALRLPERGQAQIDLADWVPQFEGTVGVALVPSAPVAAKHDRPFATGYYVVYSDAAGHQDLSHERQPRLRGPLARRGYIQVMHPRFARDVEVIAFNSTNPEQDPQALTHWLLRIRDARGAVLAEREMPPIAVGGLARVSVEATFPERWRAVADALAVGIEAEGANLLNPVAIVHSRNGDMNVHHF